MPRSNHNSVIYIMTSHKLCTLCNLSIVSWGEWHLVHNLYSSIGMWLMSLSRSLLLYPCQWHFYFKKISHREAEKKMFLCSLCAMILYNHVSFTCIFSRLLVYRTFLAASVWLPSYTFSRPMISLYHKLCISQNCTQYFRCRHRDLY